MDVAIKGPEIGAPSLSVNEKPSLQEAVTKMLELRAWLVATEADKNTPPSNYTDSIDVVLNELQHTQTVKNL